MKKLKGDTDKMINRTQLKTNPTLILDLETGGFDPKKDAVCSCSVILANGNGAKTWYIKPYGKEYSPKALEINGLTTFELEEKGVSLNEFKKEFRIYLLQNFSVTEEKVQLLGHNISFDIGFLREIFGATYPFHYHYKDSMILANTLKDLGLIPIEQSISLSNIYKFYFGEDDLYLNAHTSDADTKMSLKVYNKMLEVLKND